MSKKGSVIITRNPTASCSDRYLLYVVIGVKPPSPDQEPDDGAASGSATAPCARCGGTGS